MLVNWLEHVKRLLPLIKELSFELELINNKLYIHFLDKVDLLELILVAYESVSPHLRISIDFHGEIRVDFFHLALNHVPNGFNTSTVSILLLLFRNITLIVVVVLNESV